MKKDMILSGVGGQGILTISYLICNAALKKGWHFKQAEVHGMAQRGGAVQSHLRLSDETIHSDLIPVGTADLILSVEPIEVFRYLHFLREGGLVISDTNPYVNIPNYPEKERIEELFNRLSKKILIDAKSMAQKAGSVKAQNIVILGAACPTLGFSVEDIDPLIETLFSAKGEKIVAVNKDALRAGFDAACLG